MIVSMPVRIPFRIMNGKNSDPLITSLYRFGFQLPYSFTLSCLGIEFVASLAFRHVFTKMNYTKG